MYLPNCNIKFSGLIITEKQRRSIEQIIIALQSKSPSDSYICLQLVNGECNVNGFLKVNSKAVNFEVSEGGIDPLAVVKLLSNFWQSKLNLWIKNRVF